MPPCPPSLGLGLSLARTRRGGGFSPLSLSPALWLSDTGSNPAQWDDLSGNGRHATQAIGVNQPAIVTSAINGRQVRRFDGQNDALLMESGLSFLQDSAPHSIFLALKTSQTGFGQILGTQTFATNPGFLVGLSDSNPNRLIYRLQSAGGRRQLLGNSISVSTNNALIAHCSYAGSSASVDGMTIRINGVTETTDTTATATGEFQKLSDAAIGDRVTNPIRFSGDIAEILVIPRAVTTSERQQVESYLSSKYAITLA